MAAPLGNVVPVSGIGYIDGLLQGSKWSSTHLTYSLWDGEYEWSPFSKEVFDIALDTLSYYTNLTFEFVETNGNPSFTTDIEGMLTGSALQYNYGAIGLAVFPDPGFGDDVLAELGATRRQWPNIEGAIFYDNEAAEYIAGLTIGGAAVPVILHEMLHALGLKHPFDDGANARPTFNQLGLESLNNQYYTLMSYDPASRGTLTEGNPSTLMLLDVAALQHLYGANMNAYAGNDTHVISDTGFNYTLWDAGGIDWIDGSQAKSALSMNLNAGQFTYSADTYLSIAYNVTIENAMGSAYNDMAIGNGGGNIIHGRNGSDYINGVDGNDILYGGYGAVDATDSADTIYGDHGNDVIYGNAGNDVLYGDSDIIGRVNNGNDVIYGGLGADSLYGGNGNDTLDGGTGADLIIGALENDWLSGGDGADVFVYFERAGYDTILDFQSGDLLSIARTATIQSFADISSKIISDANGSFIPLGNDAGIILAGVARADLDASDFYFFG